MESFAMGTWVYVITLMTKGVQYWLGYSKFTGFSLIDYQYHILLMVVQNGLLAQQ